VIHAFVNIIESPSSRDLLDGRTEGGLLRESLKLAEIPNAYSLVTDRGTLEETIEVRLRAAARVHNKVPIMHFSMHGNIDGVALTNGEFVPWNELKEYLRPVIRAVRGTLLVCMSFCVGHAGARMAMNDDDEPTVWALVGNTGDANWSDAAIAYSSFYHLFFKKFNIDVCVSSMKVASSDHNFVFYLGEQTRRNWQEYINEQGEAEIQANIQMPEDDA